MRAEVPFLESDVPILASRLLTLSILSLKTLNRLPVQAMAEDNNMEMTESWLRAAALLLIYLHSLSDFEQLE